MTAPTATTASVPKIGDVVAGKFRLERELGAGGMGVVYAARHIHLNDAVALKMVLPEGADHHGARERFLREGRIAVQIKSAHVARVLDLGFLENGSPYMAMEMLHGCDLAAALRERGAMPIPMAVDYVLQACEAIAEAHSLGMVHRDLKPANLFLTKAPDGTPLVKVLDFGISKAPSANMETRLTSTGALMGSPSYMSPEQIRDAKQVDQRCDVWAVGMILYELLTNHVAFDATTVSGLLASIVADPPRHIQARRPDIPPGLGAAIMQCLEKDLRARTPSIGALAISLAPFAPAQSQRSVEVITKLLATLGQTVQVPISSKTAFDATHPSAAPPPMSNAPSGAGLSTNKAAAWGNTVPDPSPPSRQGKSNALLGAIAGAAAVTLLVAGAVGAFVYTSRSHAAPAAAAVAQPPPSAASAIPSAAPEPAPTPTPTAAATAAPSASVAAPATGKRRGKASPAGENHGDLGGAIDSRK